MRAHTRGSSASREDALRTVISRQHVHAWAEPPAVRLSSDERSTAVASRARRLAVVLITAASLCLLVNGVRSQVNAPRRLTTTAPESFNINPTLSGDGLRVVFESS